LAKKLNRYIRVCYNLFDMKKTLALITLLFFTSSSAFSFVPQPTPGIAGSTGLIRMPSADVIPYKNVNFGLDIGSNNMTDKMTVLYKMNLGTFQGMELGCVGADDGEGNIKDGVYINLKYSLATDNSPYPLLLAIGVENLTAREGTDVFMVATKYIPNGSRIHFGFVGDFAQSRFRPLGALGYDTPFFAERTYLISDMFAGEKVFQFDLGMRWYLSEAFAMNLTGVNIFANKDTPVDNYRDPKMVLIGFSIINPL
jgi:hypothetical protein